MTLVLPQPCNDLNALASAAVGRLSYHPERPCATTMNPPSYSSDDCNEAKELRESESPKMLEDDDDSISRELEDTLPLIPPSPSHKRQYSTSSVTEDSCEESKKEHNTTTDSDEFFKGSSLRYNAARRNNKRFAHKLFPTLPPRSPPNPFISTPHHQYGQVSYFYEPTFPPPTNLCYQVTPSGTICYVPILNHHASNQAARFRHIAANARIAVQNYIDRTRNNSISNSVRSSFSDSAFGDNSSATSRCSSNRSHTFTRSEEMALAKSLMGKYFLASHKQNYRSLKQCTIERPWIKIEGNSPLEDTGTEFSVMCYNVLSEKYARGTIYSYCPEWALRWSYRKIKILEEIVKYGADIVCLQEVENDQFTTFFTPKLKKHGFSGIFYPKSRWNYYNEDERKTVDGCCIFYRTNKFKLVRDKTIELNKLPLLKQYADPLMHRLTNRDNIAIMALFEHKQRTSLGSNKKQLIISTAHFFWDPAFSDVKILQSIILADALQIFEKECLQNQTNPNQNSTNKIPIVLCGDLNSLPNSGAIDFFVNGQVKANHPEFLKTGKHVEKLYDTLKSDLDQEQKLHMSHQLDLSTPYNETIMPFTNYTLDFNGTIDHMFHSKHLLQPTQVLGSLDSEWLNSNQLWAAPNAAMPSDHIPLVTKYRFKEASTKEQSIGVTISSNKHDSNKLLYSSLFKHESTPRVKESKREIEVVTRRGIVKNLEMPLELPKPVVDKEERTNMTYNTTITNSTKTPQAKNDTKTRCNKGRDESYPPNAVPKNTTRRKKNRRAAAKKKLSQQILLNSVHAMDKDAPSDSTVPNSLSSCSLASSSLSIDQKHSIESACPASLVKFYFGAAYPSSDDDDFSNYLSVSSNFNSEDTDDCNPA